MSLGIGYALAGLGQGLEQGVGNYLAQKKYEKSLAMEMQAAADQHRHSELEDAVMYGWQPDGSTPQPQPQSAPQPAPVSDPSVNSGPTSSGGPISVGALLGRSAGGPAAGTPIFGADSVLGSQHGLPSVRASLATQSPPVPPASAAPTAQMQPPADGRITLPGIGSIDPSNSVVGLTRQKTRAEIAKTQAETGKLNNEMYAGKDGYIAYQSELEKQKALATLPIQLRLEVAKGTISLGNALAVAGVQHGYKGQEITQEGGIKSALQGDAQRFELGPKANVALQNQKQDAFYKENLSPTGRLLSKVGLAPQAPSTQQQLDWDTAAAHLGGQNPAAILGPRP